MKRRLIGLTGGIASGKTTVSNYLKNFYQLPILDADLFAREAVAPGESLLAEIGQRYGNKVILPEGTLNRQALGDIIFQHPLEKIWLESKIHPYVRQRFEQQINASSHATLVLVIPLLFEAKMTDLVDEIWVVYCTEEEQIKRLKQRDRLKEEQAISRIKSQLALEEKIRIADVTLNNSSNVEDLLIQIDTAINPLTTGA